MRTTVVEIDKQKLLQNFRILKSMVNGASVMAIVKANGYGHGLTEVSKILEEAGVDFFGVAFPTEGIELRKAGITKPIVILVESTIQDIELFFEYEFQTVFSSFHVLREFAGYSKLNGFKIKSHLFIGTGMNRDGIPACQAVEFMNEASKYKGIDIIGCCTHFATADSPDRTFALSQLKIFNYTLETLKKSGFSFDYIHASNSAGIVNLPEANFNLVRPGIFLYGLAAERYLTDDIPLEPALSLKTKILQIKDIAKGDTVGYGRKFIAGRATRIAVIPIGYGDGFLWSLTNKAQCIIKGNIYNLVGSVCMDQSMVDIGSADIKPGDEVILIGSQGDKSITVFDLADKAGTIPYEVLTSISSRVPRVII